HDDNDIGRVDGQVPHAELQRIALAAARRISANRHFDARRLTYRGSIIRTVIGDHEDAVVGPELGLNVPDGRKYSRSLVMSGNEDGRAMGQLAGCSNWRGPPLAQRKIACSDLGKPDKCKKC